MTRLLHLDASAAAAGSASRALTAAFAAAFLAAAPGNTVAHRDLHADPLPHLPHPDLHWAAPLRRGPDAPDAAAAALQDRLVAELLQADALVIGYPLYNYSLPSSLKAWIDWIHVPGRTAGAATPLHGRPAVLITTRGGDYGPDGVNAGRDLATPVLELVLGEELGMDTTAIAAGHTLAADPARSEREHAAALDRARELGSRIGG